MLNPGYLVRLMQLTVAPLACVLLSCLVVVGQDTSETSLRGKAGSEQPSRMLVLGPRTPINPPYAGYHGGVMIAADPESKNNLIVCGYRANQRTGAAYEGYVYHSGDGGKTWREVLVEANSQWVSEESCAFGPGHQAYFAAGVSDTSAGKPRHANGHLHLYRSVDGGRTWVSGQVVPFMDYTSMAVDATSGPWRNTLYIFANNLADGSGNWLGGTGLYPQYYGPFLAAHREASRPSFSVTNGNFDAGMTGVKSRFPAGSAVLSDGTVLALFAGRREINDDKSGRKTSIFSAELGVSGDGGKTLKKIVVYQSAIPLAPESVAVNEGTDRIYVCWTLQHGTGEEGNLMLATSQDRGQTWSAKSVEDPQHAGLDLRQGTVSIAVNKYGVLGFSWYGKNADRVYFGVSFDGGTSINKVIPLTPYTPARPASDASLADDRRLFVFPPTWDASSGRLRPIRILRLGPIPAGSPLAGGNGMVVDRDGIFHPVWTEVANGPTHLWTRSVWVSGKEENKAVATLDGLTDVSGMVACHISDVQYDHLDNLIAFDLMVTNKSKVDILGPILAVVTNPSGGRLQLSVDNADNGKVADGALWELQSPTDTLRPQHTTENRKLTVRLDTKNLDTKNDSNAKPANYVLEIPLKIYGRLP